MTNEQYITATKYFDEFGIEDMNMLQFTMDRVLEKKLFEALDENGEYKFKYPPVYDKFNQILTGAKSLKKIVMLKGKKNVYDSSDFNTIYSVSYEFEVVLDDGNKHMLFVNDNTIMSPILEAIENDIHFKKRITGCGPISFVNEDIIITDPCYVGKHNPYERPTSESYGIDGNKPFVDYTDEDRKNSERYNNDPYFKWEKENDDWEKSNYGKNMEVLGIKNYLTHDTIYGDWSCTTYDSDTKEAIGKFCADAGLVGVFSLNEVRAYNPDIDKWVEEHKWCVTKIPNFTGEVSINVEHIEGVYEDTTKYHKKGEKWEDYEVHVEGNGSTNFITTQTGL